MKKTVLLTIAFAVTATASNAQQLMSDDAPVRMEKTLKVNTNRADLMPSPTRRAQAPKKSVANGVYYARPEGTLYTGLLKEGSSYYVNNLITPPFTPLLFKNMSTTTAGSSWTLATSTLDEFTDADGNLDFGNMGVYTGLSYPTPVLTQGSLSYQLGESGKYFSDRGPSRMMTDSITALTYVDNRTAKGYGFGGLDSDYLFGTGKVTFKDGTVATSLGVLQFYPAPTSPIYVEDMYTMVYTKSEKPLTGSGALKMTITNVVQNEKGEDVMGDQVIAEMVATADDQIYVFGPEATEFGNFSGYVVVFSNKSQDIFGSETVEPFVINDKYAVMITGCDAEGVDVDFPASLQVEEDVVLPPTEMILEDAEGIWSQPLYNDDLVVDMNFTGGFDYVEVADALTDTDGNEYPEANIFRVANDGQSMACDNAASKAITVAYLTTNFAWVDHEGNENYICDIPEWVSEVQYAEADPETIGSYEVRTGDVYLNFVCDPLPAGVDGRFAVINIEGKGYKSETPIILLQGNATKEEAIATGIAGVKVEGIHTAKSANVYNLAGQQVNKDYKGIVIKNGRKMIQK